MSSWTGPRATDYAADGVSLRRVVPTNRWPFGPPSFHEACCKLHVGGLFCDCKASDASDEEYGDGNAAITAAEREVRAQGRAP